MEKSLKKNWGPQRWSRDHVTPDISAPGWKFNNRYSDAKNIPTGYLEPEYEPNRPKGLGCTFYNLGSSVTDLSCVFACL